MLESAPLLKAQPLSEVCYYNHDNFEEDRYFNDDKLRGRSYFNYDDDDQARGDLKAGQEGRQEHLGKAGGPKELCHVVPPPEPTHLVPPLPTLPLAGLA